MLFQHNRRMKSIPVWLTAVLVWGAAFPAAAQKKKPPPPRVEIGAAAVDTAGQQESSPGADLPSLELKEYTIVGRERMQVLPSVRKPFEMSDITAREKVSSVRERGVYYPPASGGTKEGYYSQSLTATPGGAVNEAYASFGRYTDVNAGFKFQKTLEAGDVFGSADYHSSNGHVDNADFYNVTGTLAVLNELGTGVLTRNEVHYNTHEYKFYGSQVLPLTVRKGYSIDATSVTDITRWNSLNTRLEVGGQYFDPDDTDLFNWRVWGRLNGDTIVKSALLTGFAEVFTDRVKDKVDGLTAPVNTADYARASLALEGLVARNLHLKAGVAYYYFSTENADRNFIRDDLLFVLHPTEYALKIRKKSFVYPLAAVTYDMGEAGRLFVEYEPTVEPFSLVDKMQFNPYLDLNAPFTFEHVSHNLKAGWRRSYSYDLSFEFFYNDRRIKNYGILIDDAQIVNGQLSTSRGSWTVSHDNTLDVNRYVGSVNWNPGAKFTAWTSMTYVDYTISRSDFAEYVPYLPNFMVDYAMNVTPGHGWQFLLDGQFKGKRHVFSFTVPDKRNELDRYLTANITVSKQWGRHIGTVLYYLNVTDEDYEIWNLYPAPRAAAGGSVRFFW